MNDLRTAAQQALEALENLQPIIGNGLLGKHQLAFVDPHMDVAITALRTALAEQAQPVAWVECGHCDGTGKVDKYGNPFSGNRLVNCCYPDCGCDGARLCQAENGASSCAHALNIEMGGQL